MPSNLEVKEGVLNLLRTLPVCKPNSAQRNWTVRCPYCGDSKTLNHGHFSILIDLNSEEPMLYRCFKCNESGIVTSQTLEDLGLLPSKGLKDGLRGFNRHSSPSKTFADRPKNYYVPAPNSPLTVQELKKIAYLSDRLGYSFTAEDCQKYKIILSLSQFMQVNHINYASSTNPSMLKYGTVRELDKNYVGFLSSNNNKIVFRAINDEGFFGRYYKVTLDLYNTNRATFYSVVDRFNLLYKNDINVNICEGTFDALGVYLNCSKDNHSENELYFASCGYNFSSILKYLIYNGVTTNAILHIWSDGDKSDADHKRELSNSLYRIFIKRVVIHRNSSPGEKDFGVASNKILETSYELKI